MNYKKLNEIKAGKAVYKHDGTLEQLQEVEMYCEGTDSPTMGGIALHYHMRDGLSFRAIGRPVPSPDTTVYGSKDIFTEYHYFDEGAPVWAWDGNSGFGGVKAFYEDTDENSEWPYLVKRENNGVPISCKNIAPRVEDVPECSAEVPKQSDGTPVQSERKVKSVKTYTITLTEYEDGGINIDGDRRGFNRFELIGVLKKVLEFVVRDLHGVEVK